MPAPARAPPVPLCSAPSIRRHQAFACSSQPRPCRGRRRRKQAVSSSCTLKEDREMVATSSKKRSNRRWTPQDDLRFVRALAMDRVLVEQLVYPNSSNATRGDSVPDVYVPDGQAELEEEADSDSIEGSRRWVKRAHLPARPQYKNTNRSMYNYLGKVASGTSSPFLASAVRSRILTLKKWYHLLNAGAKGGSSRRGAEDAVSGAKGLSTTSTVALPPESLSSTPTDSSNAETNEKPIWFDIWHQHVAAGVRSSDPKASSETHTTTSRAALSSTDTGEISLLPLPPPPEPSSGISSTLQSLRPDVMTSTAYLSTAHAQRDRGLSHVLQPSLTEDNDYYDRGTELRGAYNSGLDINPLHSSSPVAHESTEFSHDPIVTMGNRSFSSGLCSSGVAALPPPSPFGRSSYIPRQQPLPGNTPYVPLPRHQSAMPGHVVPRPPSHATQGSGGYDSPGYDTTVPKETDSNGKVGTIPSFARWQSKTPSASLPPLPSPAVPLHPGGFTAHLIALEPAAYHAAVTHPFLKAAARRDLSSGQIEAWLAQDRLYAEVGYLRFTGLMLARLPTAADGEGFALACTYGSRIRAVLSGAISNVVREVQFFDDTALQWNLNLGGDNTSLMAPYAPVTKAYIDYITSVGQTGAFEEQMTLLWSMEKLYLEAWNTAATERHVPTLDPPRAGEVSGALHVLDLFVQNWTCSAFRAFVTEMSALLDAVVPMDSTPPHVKARCEAVWRRVLWFERSFWGAGRAFLEDEV